MNTTPALVTLRRCASVLAACAAIAGCSSPQAPRFHSLLSTDDATLQSQAAAAAAAPAGNPAFAFDIGPVGVPGAVDQLQWVVRLPDDTLRVLEQEQWVAPLRDELREALDERLTQRWNAVNVRTVTAPRASWRLRVDVQRFESVAGKEVWLASTWSAVVSTPTSNGASTNASAALACASSLREPVKGDIPELAAAHRRAVTRLADQIGATLTSLSRGEAAACPAASG